MWIVKEQKGIIVNAYRTDSTMEQLNEAYDYGDYTANIKKQILAKKTRILKKQNEGFNYVTFENECLSVNDVVCTRITSYEY